MTILSSLTRPTLERPREENEADLISVVHDQLEAAGLATLAASWKQDAIIAAQLDQNSNLQQYAMARFFNLKLLSADAAATLNARTILNLTCDGVEFIENFKAHVLPVVAKYYN